MEQIGDIKKATELGRKAQRQRCILAACVDCGKRRWVAMVRRKPACLRCRHCEMIHRSAGKVSRQIGAGGYIRTVLRPDDFFFPMTTKEGIVAEHRLVMAKYISRNLHPWELVHHKGTQYPLGSIENKQDNRIENLQIVVTGYGANSGVHSAKITCPYCARAFRVK